MDQLCYYCIDIMHWWADHTFLTYGEINILLFVIIQPLLILYGCWASIKCATTKNERTKRVIKITGISIIIFGILLTILVCLIPMLAAK